MRRPTIRDVAEKAGVGKVTVSYVLNGQSRMARISKETEERVLAAAQALEYRPNALARMLSTKRTNCLAVVFQYGNLFSSGSGFVNEVMRGVCRAAVEEGMDLMLHTQAFETPEEEANALSDGRVDGVLILRDEADATLSALLDRKFPTVQFFTRSDDPEAAWVDADNFSGGRLAAKHLLDLGHKKIGMIMGPEGSVSANDRFQGFRTALEAGSDGLDPRHLVRIPGPADAHRILDVLKLSDPPTAFFAWSDEVGIACMDQCRRNGYRVPEELSFVGFDSLEICNGSVPTLTSVRQPIYDIAAEATRLLAALARKEDLPRKQILFPLHLDVRGSSAPITPTIPKEVNL